MFTFRLSHSGRAVHRIYSTQSQEAFLEGHVAVIEELGGVPRLQIKYDNLIAAVKRVLIGKRRGCRENDRRALFRSHYCFDRFCYIPGIDGAHKRGDVGRFEEFRHAGCTWLGQPALRRAPLLLPGTRLSAT